MTAAPLLHVGRPVTTLDVVVTGVGHVSPLGLGVDEAWARCARGESGIGPTPERNLGAGRGGSGGESPRFNLGSALRLAKNEKFMGRGVRLLTRAALDGLAASGLDLGAVDPYRVALYTASGQTGLEGSDLFSALELASTGDEEQDFANLGGRASRLIDRYFSLRTLANGGLGLLSAEIGARGPSDNFVQGDVAAPLALASARHDLLEDRADVAVIGAYDSLLDVSPLLAFDSAGLLSASDPTRAHRPFDRERDGVVLGEGAAVLVLERGDDARGRGAPIAGEVGGVGTATPVGTVVDEASRAEAARAAIEQAAGAGPVDLVVAHGVGTVDADRLEARILASLLGAGIPVVAFKGQTGYLGAAGPAVEWSLALQALRRRCVPPIARHDAADPDCGLDLVTGRPRALGGERPTALCLSWSWLGQCAAVTLRAPEPA